MPFAALSAIRFTQIGTPVVIGASTHVFWDSFTHANRWGTRLLPGLSEPVFQLAGSEIPGFKMLQYGSTLVLLPILLVAFAKRTAASEPLGLPQALSQQTRVAVWLFGMAVPPLIAMVCLYRNISAYAVLGCTVKSSIGVYLAAFTVLGAFLKSDFP